MADSSPIGRVTVVPHVGWPESSPQPNGFVARAEPRVSRETTSGRTALGWPPPAALGQVDRRPVEGDRDPAPPPPAVPEPSRPQRTPDPQLPLPAQTRVVAVTNQKGGVGKTTTAVNLAAALAKGGQRVLVVDLDPQGNASTALSIDHSEGTPGVYEVLVGGTPIRDVVRASTEIDRLEVLPASIDLAGAEIDLVSLVARESRLNRALDAYLHEQEQAGRRVDYVFVDCPPSLGLLTLNALVAGKEILIPIQCEYYALEGVGQLLRTVEMVRTHLNPDLTVSTIVLTMHDARTRLSSGVADEVRAHFPDQVLRTAIPRSVRISEAPSYGQTVLTYDAGSSGALSYREAARELAIRGAAGTTTGGTP